MATWFTADQHFGHANIIGYSGRPFRDVAAMNSELVTRWNHVVARDDVVYVLGDVALGRPDETLELVPLLRGRKNLLAGNHDRCWSGHGSRSVGWADRYLAAGFDAVEQGTLTTKLGRHRVRMSHLPYRTNADDQDRHAAHRPIDRGEWLLHGHVHERWRQHGRMINVGVDAWDYAPVSAEEIAHLISAGPADTSAQGR
ncbi:MAG: hypothetical protein R2705_15240 [Ilumatobacteraceae bacterium]